MLKIHLETRTKSENFVKIVQTSDPWGVGLWPRFEILTVLGAVFPHFCPDKREIWHGSGPLPVPNFTFIGATCRPCGAKKTIFGPLSKNYTGMAALRAGLPVKKSKIKTLKRKNMIRMKNVKRFYIDGLTLYPRKPPCMRYGLVSTESQMKSAVVLVTSLSGSRRNFWGISNGTATYR